MCLLRFLGRFKRFAAVGGSDGVLRGFGEWLEEDQRGRFCMLNRRNYTRNGHDWNLMSDMEFESLRGGGSYFWKGGSRKGGFGRTPRTPPGYGPAWSVLPEYHVPLRRLYGFESINLCKEVTLHLFPLLYLSSWVTV